MRHLLVLFWLVKMCYMLMYKEIRENFNIGSLTFKIFFERC